MIDSSRHEAWATMMAQARNFAVKENFYDAVSRVRQVQGELQEALRSERDATEQERLERLALRVNHELAGLEVQLEQWRARLAEHRADVVAHAADEMNRPLPKGLPP